MLGGDFNAALLDDRIAPMLEQQGFQDVMHLAKAKWPDQIHPTCMDVTYPDNLLVKGPLCSKSIGARVHKEKGLGAHLPFTVHFLVSTDTEAVMARKLPKDWTKLKPDPRIIDSEYQLTRCTYTESTADSLEVRLSQWAGAVEAAVDNALKRSGDPDGADHLPAVYRGRCLPKFSNNRTYDPLVDLVSFTAVHKTRQVRRLYSFRRTLATYCGPSGAPAHHDQLRHVWNAIRTARGYTPDFPTWIQQCTGVWYLDCINLEALRWVDQVILHCRTDCDQFACQSRTMRTKDFRTKLKVDWGQHGGRFTALLLRKPAFAAANHMTFATRVHA